MQGSEWIKFQGNFLLFELTFRFKPCWKNPVFGYGETWFRSMRQVKAFSTFWNLRSISILMLRSKWNNVQSNTNVHVSIWKLMKEIKPVVMEKFDIEYGNLKIKALSGTFWGSRFFCIEQQRQNFGTSFYHKSKAFDWYFDWKIQACSYKATWIRLWIKNDSKCRNLLVVSTQREKMKTYSIEHTCRIPKLSTELSMKKN